MSKTNEPDRYVVPDVTFTSVQFVTPTTIIVPRTIWVHASCGCIPCRCGTSLPCNGVVKTW